MKLSVFRPILCLAALLFFAAIPVSPAADEKAPVAAAGASDFNAKNTFRNICSFCHEDYGRKAGKGPQLMNNTNSDEYLFNRIKNGKAGRMAAFGGAFTDDQIRDMVKFIRSLRPDQEP
ncbi:MAG: cytochrome c [Burkholderiales bacterium]|nr:cytochrome c [Burkholderiales bacterium]